MKRRLREKTYTAVGSDMLVVEEMQDTFKKIVADDVRHDAAVITTPTLLIYGDQDHATPPRYGQLLHNAIPGSRLETLSGAGHFVHHDKEDQVEALVMEFLA
jgi:pimeloyl-ACP methyl ester carboxylesterase